MMSRLPLFVVTVAFALAFSAGVSAAVQNPPMLPEPDEKPALVGVGSGWAIGGGNALTADHVVVRCHRIQIQTHDGNRAWAEIVTRDPARDIAVLHSSLLSGVPRIPLAQVGARRGETVRVVGFPGGENSLPSYTGTDSGEVDASTLSGTVITTHPDRHGHPQLAMETRLDSGSSGSVVIDERGRAVGMAVGMLDTERYERQSGRSAPPIGFAVPVGALRDLLPQDLRWPASLSTEFLPLDEIEERVVRVICLG